MTINEAIEQQIKAAEAFEKSALEECVSELTREGRKKVASEHRQIAEWLMELKEAKRLLKVAVEDMHIEDMCDVCVERIPNSPIHCPDGSNCFVWRYKDEALKLIGEDVNGI